MKIKVSQRGGDRNNHEIYKDAVRFFAHKLIRKELHSRLQVKIIMGENLNKDAGFHQFISMLNHVIYVDKYLPFNDIISTIAHEMVHVRQVIDGEFKPQVKGFLWQGKRYKDDIYKNASLEEQKKIPWEVEPYAREAELAREFAADLFAIR